MDKFVLWYKENYKEITWFLIGFLVMAGLYDLKQGDYSGAIFSFSLAGLNYWMDRR
jgi:hypothetical protein